MADILITRLSSLKHVAVRPTSAVVEFEDTANDSKQIGTKLGVDAVLEGTIFQTRNDVRVTMRLVGVQDSDVIWSGEFEKPLNDELRLQDEIALKIVDALSLSLNSKERQTLTKHYTENRDAYAAYLRGRFFFDKRDDANYHKAMSEFENAIRLDPNYALAYAGLADVYAMQANSSTPPEVNALYENAKIAALKALTIDDELAEAHTSVAWILRIHDWNWVESEKEFKRAIELNPNYYNAHMWYALLLVTLDRKDEALPEIERAKELFPTNPIVLQNYFSIKYYCDESEALLPIADQMISLGVDSYRASLVLERAYLRTEQYQRVIDDANKYLSLFPDRDGSFVRSYLAIAYGKTGESKRSNEILRTLEEQAKVSPETAFRLANAYGALGRKEEAIAQLQRCLQAHDDRLMWIKVEPSFASFKDDERFQEILKKMNLAG